MTRPAQLMPALLAMLASGAAVTAHARGDPRLEVELALGISGSTELRTVIMTSPLLTLSAPVTAETAFVAQWGFTIASGEPSSEALDATYFATGNPLIGWSILFFQGFTLTPSLTLPIARRPEGDAARAASEFAFKGGLGLRGAVDPWLWVPDQISFVLPLAYVKWFDPILFEAHLKLGFLSPTNDADSDSDFVFQWKARVAAHLGGGFWLAAGITGVYTPTDTVDNFQSALSPELRYVISPGSHLELSLLMNLDTPYGPFSEPGKFWAVHIGGSAPL